MTRSENDDRPPQRPPGETVSEKAQRKRVPSASDNRRQPPRRQVDRWHIRRFEFPTSEAALLYAACVIAVAMTADIWPVVELHRRSLRLRLRTGLEATPLERAVWTELLEWARRLGGRDMTEPASALE